MGDGSFKTAIWNTATTHLSERFPNQKGLMKTAEMCKGKVTSLKTVLRDINLWHAHSGKHWDNSNGANIAMEDEEKDFQDWMGWVVPPGRNGVLQVQELASSQNPHRGSSELY
ncbi:hypothetical protein F5141DRAFT_1066905 [Pisolithus sp. B1]|nr:hypothetical protein F5141DRAFT_1066905 [Pisolithus sp. B1]